MRHGRLGRIIAFIILIIAAVVTVFPIYWTIQISLKSQKDALSYPPQFIFKPNLKAWQQVFDWLGFVKGLVNSVIVSGITILLSLVIGVMAAYALSRFKFRGNSFVLFSILVTRIFPPVALIMPLYLTFRVVGLHDSYLGLALSYMAMVVPLVIWMLKGYFDTLPKDLENSAMLDGASRFQAVMYVTLPLVAPGIVATGIFAMIISWNEFLFALILTSSNAKTLPVVIAEFVGETGVDWPLISAAAVIAILPAIIFTYIIQRNLVYGITAGAVKG